MTNPPFEKSLRALDAKRAVGAAVLLAVIAALAAVGAAWMCCGRVTLYAVSLDARVEVDATAHPITAPVEGVVIESSLPLGRAVSVGDPLLVLDSTAEALQLAEQRARLGANERTLEVVRKELEGERKAQALAELARGAASSLALARRRSAKLLADVEADEYALVRRLRDAAVVSEAEATDAMLDSARQGFAATEQGLAVRTVRSTEDVGLADREIRAIRLEREIVALVGMIQSSRALILSLEHEVERRTIRAPVDGAVADVSPVTAGTYLAQGQRVAAVVPASGLRVVATLSPADAVGRVHPGQPAVVRLDGFPWAQYGTHRARVTEAATEAQGGSVRVELVIPEPTAGLPLTHGLTSQVEVEIESLPPVLLLARALGSLVSPASAPATGDPSP